MEITWGIVQSLSPTTVRFAGDTSNAPIAVRNVDVTLTVGDKVALLRLGMKDGWCVAFVIGATA